MASSEHERMDAISTALAGILRRQDDLERRLARIETTLKVPILGPPPVIVTPPVVEAPAPSPPPLPDPEVAREPAPVKVPFEQPPVREPSPSARLETNIGLTLVNRIGAVTLVLGIAFFFKWAVDNQWIGPAGRVELGLLAGLLTLAGGELVWRRQQRVFAQGITATGISILYLATYAGFDFYHLLPQPLAFAAMVITTLLSGALAVRYNAIAMAALGLFGGFITPLLLSTGDDHPWFLFGYILALDVGAVILARSRKWMLLEILSFFGTVLLFGGWLFQFKEQNQFVGTFFALLFYAVYAATFTLEPLLLIAQLLTGLALLIVNEKTLGRYFVEAILLAAGGLVLADRRRWRAAVTFAFGSFWLFSGLLSSQYAGPKPIGTIFFGYTCGFLLFLSWPLWWFLRRKEPARTQDLAVLALNGAAYFGASYRLLNPLYHTWLGLFAIALAAVYLGLAYEMWRREPDESARDLGPVLLTVGVAAAFFTLAVPIQFSSYRITMAWALEAAALSWIGARLRNQRMVLAATGVFALVLMRLLVVDAWVTDARFLTFLIAAACFWLAAKWVLEPAALRLAFYISGHIVLLWALTQKVIDWAGHNAAVENLMSLETMSVSLLYAVYAITMVGIGVATRTAVNRISGLVLIGVVVIKLYLFDVWQLARVYRTLAFVALGVLLLSMSFLYSHFRALIESWWKDDPSA